MAANIFDASYSAVALAAATAKTVIGVKAADNIGLRWLETSVSFDGATSTNVPAKVEICTVTFATNAPGTNSTSLTPAKRDPARPETIQATAGHTWSAEPTVISALRVIYVGVFNGVYHYINPFASPVLLIGGTGSRGCCIRLTAPAIVNTSGHVTCEE